MAKRFQVLAVVGLLAALTANPASAARLGFGFGPSFLVHHHPLPFHGRHRAHSARALAEAKTAWTPVTAASPFGENGAGTAILMTDGTVLIQDNTNNWYRLTPDNTGSYINGTWSQAASMSSGYGPLYFASAILPDGRLLVEGGEYNFFQSEETNQGAIYDPVANAWTPVSPPKTWSEIGDGQSVVLPNGTLMLGNCCYTSQALFNPTTLGWTITGTGKADGNSEEGWTLLANGLVFTADVGDEPNSELYNPSTGSWSTAGNAPVNLTQSYETGPEVLMADGDVFAAGAGGPNAVYDSVHNAWSVAESFPKNSNGQQLDIADGPGALLPDGKVMLATSPGVYQTNAQFFLWNGKKLKKLVGTPNAPDDSSYYFRFLVLPTGQILVTDGSDDVEIYVAGGKAKKKLAPVITSVPTTLTHGSTYSVTGTYLNGFSQGAFYGDDASMATNYPLVVITNTGTHDVFFARTHDFSAMPVANSAPVSANFDVPAGIETGPSNLQVVTNGIQSAPISVTIN